MNSEIVLHRLEIINSAKRIGISKTAELYNIDRSTIRRWIKRFENDGEEGLNNNSKKGKFQFWNQIPAEDEQKIIELKQINPDLSISKIKEKLKLSYSRSTIHKKLKENGLVGLENFPTMDASPHFLSLPFSTFYVHIKKLNSSYENSFSYQIIITEKLTNLQFSSFCSDFDEINILIFIDYFLSHITKTGLNNNSISIYLKRIKNRSLVTLIKKVESRYSAKIEFSDQIDSQYKKSIIDNNTLKDESHGDKSNFLNHISANLILQNSILLSKFNNKSFEFKFITEYKDSIVKLLYVVKPLDIDNYFNIDKIFRTDDFWSTADTENSSFYVNDELLKISASFAKNYENTKAIALYDTIINSAKFIEDFTLLVASMMNKGIIFQKIGEWSEAMKTYETSLKIARKKNLFDYQVKILSRIGAQYFIESKFRESISPLKKSLQMCRELNFQKDEINALINLGASYQKLGELNKAIRIYTKLQSKLKDNNIKKVTLYANFGVIYENKKQFNKSREYYEKGLILGQNLNAKRPISQILNNLGNLYLQNYEDDKCIESYKQLLKLAKEQENNNWIGLAYNNIGKYNFTLGKFVDSLNCYRMFLEISKNLNDIFSIGIAHLNIAEVYLNLESVDIALEEIEMSIKKLEEIEEKIYLPISYQMKGLILLRSSRFLLAEKCFKQAMELSSEIQNPDLILNIEIYMNINKTYRIIAGYKRYQQSLGEMITELYEQLEKLEDFELDKDSYSKFLSMFYHLITDKFLDSITLNYSISLEKMRILVKNELSRLYSDLYIRSKREKYLMYIDKLQ